MIFADLAHYPAPPSNAGTEYSSSSADDCLSAVLSSPCASTFDELSPYPAPPSTASTDGSSCAVSSSFALTQAANTLTVTIPPRDAAIFDLGQFPAPPLSAGTDSSLSSFATQGPAMSLYSSQTLPPSSSGCLYEAAMSQAVAPQTTFPAHFNFRASYPGALPMSEVSQPQFVASTPFHSREPVNSQSKQYGGYPTSTFDFSIPASPATTHFHIPTPAESLPAPIPQLPPVSNFMGSFMMGAFPFSNPIPGPEFLNHVHRHSVPRPSFLHFSAGPPMHNGMPPLSRAKDEQEAPGLNLYDATGIRDSGLLFASNGRILLACNFCKARKLRCNGGAPGCSQCAKRGLCCSYPSTIRRRGKAKRKMGGDSVSQDGDEPEGLEEEEADLTAAIEFLYKVDSASRAASEEPDLERSRKRKGTSFGSESLLAPAYKKRSQSCHGTVPSSSQS
ncbi:unnamed protein product [Tilletia controversa]|nr:unnamed protein product [Tilletia controversa]